MRGVFYFMRSPRWWVRYAITLLVTMAIVLGTGLAQSNWRWLVILAAAIYLVFETDNDRPRRH